MFSFFNFLEEEYSVDKGNNEKSIEGMIRLGPRAPRRLSTDLEAKSCLTVTVRKAIYCTKINDCPDFAIATITIRNPKMSRSNSISYRIVVPSDTEPNKYLIEATLNRGWCHKDEKDSKSWIRNGDYFNDFEYSVEIDKPGKYDKDIRVIEYNEKKSEFRVNGEFNEVYIKHYEKREN